MKKEFERIIKDHELEIEELNKIDGFDWTTKNDEQGGKIGIDRMTSKCNNQV